MEEKYQISDIYGNALNCMSFDEYAQVMRWAYNKCSEYELVGIKTDYTSDTPSKRIIKFIFRKV